LFVFATFASAMTFRVHEDTVVFSVESHFRAKFIRRVDQAGFASCELLDAGLGQMNRLVEKLNATVYERRPLVHEREQPHDHDHDHIEEDQIIEAVGIDEQSVFSAMQSLCKEVTKADRPAAPEVADEVFSFRNTGPSNNRIDVVFMGDGYTQAQRQLYIDDMNRMIDDMFQGTTFSSYLPVFNIWGVFRASRESGIGVGGRPRNTAFGLYRDGTQLRGVFTSRPNDARAACRSTGPSACDFPSLIGNDLYYGGLGGEFTISTSSITSGTMVLRHEMGHNYVNVGEEYDGGGVYRGVNFSPTLNVQWRHWLTDQSRFPPVAEQSQIRVQNYAWYDLASGPYRIAFNSPGTFARWFLIFTASGCERDDTFRVTLDGRDLGWKSSGTLDRSFWSTFSNTPLSAGAHELVFTSLYPPAQGQPIRQLCSLTMHEYAAEPAYHFDNNYIGAYNTYRQGPGAGTFAGYRPNNERCLMRNMTSEAFCSICKEGMWYQFLARMNLIDNVTVTTASGNSAIRANVVPLAQFRPRPVPGERFDIWWLRNGVRQTQYDNQFSFSAATPSLAGSWTCRLNFVTEEVRADPRNLLQFQRAFTI